MSPLARFIAASGATNLADGIATVAWAWLASLITRDPVLIATVAVSLRLPWFLFALPAGIVTDRVDRRRLILAMDVIRGAGFALAAAIIWASLPLPDAPARGLGDPILFLALISLAMIVGTAEVFRDNAAQTMLPALVNHAQLEIANGRLWSVELVGNALLGPALGALLIATALPLPFALNALAYLVAVLAVLKLSGSFRPKRKAARNWRYELREGMEFLKSAPLLRALAWITGGWNLLHHLTVVALLLHVQENLGIGARGYGLILAASAVGGIVAGIIGAKIAAHLGPGRSAQVMLAASAPCFLAMALAPGPVTLSLVLMVFEFCGVVWNTVSVSYRQRVIPDEILGRVNSIYRLLAWGMIPLGLLLSGVILRLAETMIPRDLALLSPFGVAAIGALWLTFAAWRRLGAGFSTT